eukprot:TRINITY_DN7145_c0_g1_i2.p1 TRINITY_DN7145_c0_g1~~TRINITY_DN7145_c0_g1_i2.p1  ORF type:complete len:355 (-),score=58.57 TRINITY_DN7145_c0_g1_i2:14-1078(-)
MSNKYNENCMLAGVKVSHSGDIFVSVPRWKLGVPATLNRLVTVGSETLLQPYPSWEMNEVGNVTALQSVLGFEIDSKNRLWVLDQGKVGTDPALPGSIKLVIFDLFTNQIIQSYVFSEELASLSCSFLNDIVVDMQNGYGYITDTGRGCDVIVGGLLVYDYLTNTARRVLNQVNSTQPDPLVWVNVNGELVTHDAPMEAGADGIALSPDTTTLFYCPLTGRNLYSIPTASLRNATMPEAELEEQVNWVGFKLSASDGLACSNAENTTLYMTAIEMDAILVSQPFYSNITVLTNNTQEMMWPDTIGFDHEGWLLFVSNQLQRFTMDEMNFDEVNFRIWRVFIDAGSYLDPTPVRK